MRMNSATTSFALRLIAESMKVLPNDSNSPFCHAASNIAKASSCVTDNAETVESSNGTPVPE